MRQKALAISGDHRPPIKEPVGIVGYDRSRHALAGSPNHQTMTDSPKPHTTALVVAHPGHELRVYHWVEQNRPIFCCLTDGSGGWATSRLSSTARLLDAVGAPAGPVYGRYADTQVYTLLLEGRVDVFVALAQELAAAFATAGVDCVAGDAVEGFNPSHDVCRLIVDGAVEILRRQTGREVRNYEFVLDGPPEMDCPGAIVIRLDEAALDRKLAAAHEYTEMRGEVEAALERYGRQAFATECLHPIAATSPTSRFEEEAPAYERFGEKRVKEGRYSEIIRYRDHVRPVAAAIAAAVDSSPRCASSRTQALQAES